jgi:nucleotide-binding universal stress UspA family protein
MFKSIVCGTDDSPTARQAVEKAADLARLCGATLHIVNGYGIMPAVSFDPAAGAAAALVATNEDVLRDVEAMLQDTLARVGSGLTVKTHAVLGGGAGSILDVAEHIAADLIVVGSRGMTGARRFLLGNVPNKVSHHAPCSVLIVHTV